MLVTSDGADIATLPSQCWVTRLARTVPKNNRLRGEGRGAGKGHFRLGCEVSQPNLSRTVFRKNSKYAVLNVTTFEGKTGHYFRAVEGDCHDMFPLNLGNCGVFS